MFYITLYIYIYIKVNNIQRRKKIFHITHKNSSITIKSAIYQRYASLRINILIDKQ